LTSGNQEVDSVVVKPEDIRKETRRGTEILVVQDHLGQEFTNILKEGNDHVLQEKNTFLDQPWQVFYSIKDGRFLNFHGFGTPGEDKNLLRNRLVDASTTSDRDEETSARINRQNAQQHASRIVQGKMNAGMFGSEGFESGADVEDVDEKIVEELEKWTGVFQSHAESGEWPDSVE